MRVPVRSPEEEAQLRATIFNIRAYKMIVNWLGGALKLLR